MNKNRTKSGIRHHYSTVVPYNDWSKQSDYCQCYNWGRDGQSVLKTWSELSSDLRHLSLCWSNKGTLKTSVYSLRLGDITVKNNQHNHKWRDRRQLFIIFKSESSLISNLDKTNWETPLILRRNVSCIMKRLSVTKKVST